MPPYRLPIIRLPLKPQVKLSAESFEKKQEVTIPTYNLSMTSSLVSQQPKPIVI